MVLELVHNNSRANPLHVEAGLPTLQPPQAWSTLDLFLPHESHDFRA